MDRRVRAMTGVLVVVIGAACSLPTDPPADKPAREYASIEELADALGERCEDFKDSTHRVKAFEFGRCRSADGKGNSFLISVFPDQREYDEQKEDDSRGCNGPMIYGPNWNAGPLGHRAVTNIHDTVGGEVVGAREEGEC